MKVCLGSWGEKDKVRILAASKSAAGDSDSTSHIQHLIDIVDDKSGLWGRPRRLFTAVSSFVCKLERSDNSHRTHSTQSNQKRISCRRPALMFAHSYESSLGAWFDVGSHLPSAPLKSYCVLIFWKHISVIIPYLLWQFNVLFSRQYR